MEALELERIAVDPEDMLKEKKITKVEPACKSKFTKKQKNRKKKAGKKYGKIKRNGGKW